MSNEFNNPAFEHCFDRPGDNQLTHTITTILDQGLNSWSAPQSECERFCKSIFNLPPSTDLKTTANPTPDYFEESTKWDAPPAHCENDPQDKGDLALARIRANMFAKQCLNREEPFSANETMDAYLRSKKVQRSLENPSISEAELDETYITADEWSTILKVYEPPVKNAFPALSDEEIIRG